MSYHDFNPSRPWTGADVIEVTRLWRDEGFSAGIIAKKIGRSRNSVIGKVHRLGLMRPLASEPKVKKPYPKRVARVARRLHKQPVIALIWGEGYSPDIKPPTPLPADEGQSGGRALLEPMGHVGCRWIVSGQGAEARFCCVEITRGSYCTAHAKRCYMGKDSPAEKATRELIRSLRRVA